MTRAEIEAMSAGVKLDRIIAEKVMGWVSLPRYNYWMTFGPGDAWDIHKLIRTWHPSTDKVAAQDVAKKANVNADQEPHAICIAALLAVLEENKQP